jgi:hypothetical protein
MVAGVVTVALRTAPPAPPRASAPAVPPAATRVTPPTAPLPPSAAAAPAAPAAGPRDVWERWTRSDLSGGVLLQATLRTAEELGAEVQAEARSRGWTEAQGRAELQRALAPFHFDRYHYVYVHARSLVPGYPAWLDDPAARFTLRDDRGHEVRAVLPAGHERERTVSSVGAGDLARGRGDLVYETTLPLAFPRTGLAPEPAYLQLVARDLGTTARRVLLWELE